ncbi:MULTISPECIES: hypothetical protein [Sphingobium]|jgi:hypothetical protein|uniref:Uncharacterized protein n=3 Tax=Sphingobium TaxID=165695 RepID=A0A6P1GEE7_SPHYA|nr:MULTISPECIES: hypothetical protein [Sphingobium]EQB16527.1 hypothetical protein RLDS_06845 [Sphingobium lactosutens DS20]QDC36663.1 hypothetical protein FIL70_04825 [Sphingobium fuliginis ATCC 27551]QHD66760.1 hypothetical protein GS397_06645 [Sphingobium yanoikuyae]QNG43851.1 hypothetical protein H3V42_18200 [Sphingobium yanoikuyae]
MIAAIPTPTGSSTPATLATFDHAYAVALQKRRETGRPQFVLRTGDPRQPFRVSATGPKRDQALMTLIA